MTTLTRSKADAWGGLGGGWRGTVKGSICKDFLLTYLWTEVSLPFQRKSFASPFEYIYFVVYKGILLSNSRIIGEKPILILNTLSNQHTLNWTHSTWLMCLFCNENERGKSQDSPVSSGIKRTPNQALFVGLRIK